MVPGQVKTLADFIAWCRANPKQATYGTVGAGSLHHFIGAALARRGSEFVHTYLIKDCCGSGFVGRPDCGDDIPVSALTLPYVRSGSFGPSWATTGTQRSPSLPDVPTVREPDILP